MNKKQKGWYKWGWDYQRLRANSPIQAIQEAWSIHSPSKDLFEFRPLFEFFQKGARDQYGQQQKQS